MNLKLLFVILITIFLIYIFKNDEFFSKNNLSIIKKNVNEDLDNPNDIYNEIWNSYILGDLIKGYILKVKDYNYLNQIKKRYYGSIAHEFLEKTKGEANDNILFQIIKNRSKKLKYKVDVCMHLRLGDVVTNGKKPDNISYNNRFYNSSLKVYDDIIKKLKYEHKINEITILGGAHFKINYINESLKFVNEIKNIINSHGFTTNIRLGNNPDEDFLIMCNSKIFIKAGGGFSRKIAEYVEFNGGIVFDPNNFIIK